LLSNVLEDNRADLDTRKLIASACIVRVGEVMVEKLEDNEGASVSQLSKRANNSSL